MPRYSLTTLALGALGLCAALAAACRSIQVETDYDLERDFSALATFDFHPAPPDQEPDPRVADGLLDDRIRAAVVDELTAKGFRRTPGETPDFWVAYHVGVESKIDVTTLHQSYPYYGSYRYGGPWTRSETVAREYEQGTLLLDLLDPAGEALIWRGSGKVLVENLKTPQKRDERVREVVARVLRDFPPKRY